MTDDPNRRIGDYEVLGVLGSGGMGKVFKVRNVISDRIEAMKVLLPDLAGRQELADRFLREIKLLASLDHPNIAQLRTALTLSNRLVMVMEYVEGTTLADRLEQGAIPPAEAVGYMKQVLSALAYAHGRNVIHRDIKPANMMLTPSGTVKLMDFGIARASGDASMTVTGTTVGSLYYMSPEQVKGSTVDARSDLYSLGVSLYEMVTGQRPFKATSDYSIMTAQLQERPKPPSELQPGLPPQLNGIILHAMAKEPADRFQNADEFGQALESLGLIASTPFAPVTAVAQPVTPVPAIAAPTATTAIPAPPVSGTMSMPAPPPPTQAMPAPSVMDLSPKPHKGRGLYMALGAAVVLIVLVLAGISFPRWMKTRANEQKQADQNASSNQSNQPNSNATTSNPPPSDNGNSSTAKPDDSANNGSSGTSGPNASSSTSNSPDSANSASSSSSGSSDGSSSAGSGSNEGSTTAKTSGAKKPSKSKGSSATSGSSSSDQGSASASDSGASNSSADTAANAELEELEHDVDQTSSRSNAVSSSLDNMRRSMSAQGLNLRGDIASAEELMKINLDKAQQAIQNHDAKSAKKYLGLAQGNLEKIEKFLGH